MKEKLSVIIPAFNEERNLERIPSELLPVLDSLGVSYEVVIVNDGSSDRTQLVAQRLCRKHRSIRLLVHPKNKGLGEAMKTGLHTSSGTLVAYLDADFTFHPSELPKLLEKYNEGGYDCVIGTPFARDSGTKMQLHRLILSKSVNLLYRLSLGRPVTSISAIFRLYRRSALVRAGMKSADFDVNAEILFSMLKLGMSVVEVPVTLTARIYGESKMNNVREIKNHLKLLSEVVKWRMSG